MTSNNKTTVGDYLLTRLVQLNCKKVFGVPGDFNLGWLDLVEDHADIDYVGNCNELNAAYAADGYARVSGTVGALVTTFGVGELSAINGIAGSFSERVPVVHIVGVPGTSLQAQHAILHHTLGDGRFDAFSTAAKQVTAAQAFLENAKTSGVDAGAEIDRVLRQALLTHRPVYLTLPTDLVYAEINADRLEVPLSKHSIMEIQNKFSDESVEDHVVEQIVKLYEGRQRPVILIDSCAARYEVTELVQELVEKTNMKFFTSPMAKGALPESHPNFGGVYIGSVTNNDVKEVFESADFYLSVGAIMSDFNTGSFSYRMPKEQMVELHSDYAQVQYARYDGVTFFSLLPKLIKRLTASNSAKPKAEVETAPNAGLNEELPKESDLAQPLGQDKFWATWGTFFRDGDVILAETGTSSFGILDVKLPAKATLLAQVLWGSIGYTGGAVLGAAMAAREQGNRRTILFIGDGSLQLTVQELSTIVRQGLKPIVVVLNNDGYTIERKIHGPERVYNDIQQWRWRQLFETFGAEKDSYRTYLAATQGELKNILEDPEFAKADKLQMLEVILPKQDAPRALIEQANMTAQSNKY